MKILALETSAKSVSVAVTEDGALLSQAYQNRGLTHSVTLMPLLDGMLRTAGLSMDDMDAVAVACGPGSFTGIRIGISAAKGLAEVLAPMEFGTPSCPLYSNVTAQPYEDGQFKDLLSRQVENPVRWQTIVENMIAAVDTFIEVGPGKTLAGLIGKINSDVRALNVEDAESLKHTIEEVKA